MDRATREIIIRLCTEAGVRMEDASVIALTISRLSDAELGAALDQLVDPADVITARVGAARSLRMTASALIVLKNSDSRFGE